MAQQTDTWPSLHLSEWRDTFETLHMWTQIVGKTRLRLAPWQNHWWHVPLYVSARGLTTTTLPYGQRTFDIEFDFVDHRLVIRSGEGAIETVALKPQSVAAFYRLYLAALDSLNFHVEIWPVPVEVQNPIRFNQDQQHAAYDPEYANRFWRTLVLSEDVFKRFRGGFLGKCSPVHFFWGSFDLAVTSFSGRRAPPRPDADVVTQEAYSHEVFSAGFWPGGGSIDDAAFYAYAAPEPPGFKEAPIQPEAAFYEPGFSIFILPYEAVRAAPAPDEVVLAFLNSTYDQAVGLGNWNRRELEYPIGPDRPRVGRTV